MDHYLKIFRPRILWAMISHPVNRRLILASVMELVGISLVLYGLYLIHVLAFIIGLGGICLFLAQGLTRGDET